MQKKKKSKPNWIKLLQRIFTFLCSVTIFAFVCYFKGFEPEECLSCTVLMGVGIGVVFSLSALFEEKNLLSYDNGQHLERFYLIWMISLVFSIGFSFLPTSGWPYLFLFVLLALYSNTVLGIVSGIVLLTVSIMLSGAGISIFIMYLFTGLAGVCMFSKLDENYHIGIPLMVSVMTLMITLTAGVVIFENSKLKLELFIIPFLNVVISSVLLIILLKVFSITVIFKYRDIYLEITDSEYSLMTKLKNEAKSEYYKALHTAYFCDRICKRLNLDSDACKAAGYYHVLGCLTEHQTWDEISKLCAEHHFPDPVTDILEEYLNDKILPEKKETAVLFFSEGVIFTILNLLHEGNNAKPDYDEIIETVFKTKLQTGKMNENNITLDELCTMKNIFKEEKLYYDFLH